MTGFSLDVHADFARRRNISTHTEPSGSVYSEKARDIQALDGCPGPVTFLLQFYLLVSNKQLQVIPRICNILQIDFCVAHKISGVTWVGVKRRTV